MGQKTHPYAFRIGIVNDWKSKWYSENNYVDLVNEDWRIRDYLEGELLRGAVSRIDIERTRDRLIVDIHTARPGVVIGRRGSEAERLRSGLEDLTGRPVKLNINEVKDPDLDAALLARGIADQLENRIAFRRAMKRAITSAMKAGAEGVRVEAKGRLGGSDMGRREWYREGRVPLHTLRADIDFGTATARTTVGAIGIKVWVYKGEVIESASTSDRIAAEADLATGGPARRRRQSVKARAETAAEGGERKPRLIEAGGGKRLVEAGGGKREGGRRIIEAGGGRRPTAAEAKVEYDAAREDVVVEEDSVDTPVEDTADDTPAEVTPVPEGETAPVEIPAAPEEVPAEDEEPAEGSTAEVQTSEEPAAEEAPAPESQEGPYGPGSAAPSEDGSGPSGWEVKGNANSMLFHTPQSPYYGRTKAEVWFQDEATASAAGFRRWDKKNEEDEE
ncbi:MAG TPA: 30S ribosomal protein S3 [Acidimicrobiia bacterium]|nr:30S ribosomal protein S3 [Acidimicrobiia bacterium]